MPEGYAERGVMFSEGVKLLDAGNPDAALENFQAAAEDAKTPAQKADALYNLAVCYVRLRQTVAAIETLSAALNVDPALARDAINDSDFAPLRSHAKFRRMLHRADSAGASVLHVRKANDDASRVYEPLGSRASADGDAAVQPDYYPPSLPVVLLRCGVAAAGIGSMRLGVPAIL